MPGQFPKEYLTEFWLEQAVYLVGHSDLFCTRNGNFIRVGNGRYFSENFYKKKEISPAEVRNLDKQDNSKITSIIIL